MTNQDNHKAKRKKWFRAYKKTLKCERCFENHSACLEFHHRDDKFRQVGQMPSQGYSIECILEEMDKCTVLCANCHRKEHHSG